MIQYAVKALEGGVLTEGDEDLLMYLPNDGSEADDMIKDLQKGSGYGVDYVVVEREVGPWSQV